jgi:hypothetical protein
MRQATVMFENKGNGKVTFLRGRIQEKEARWNPIMEIGKNKFEQGNEYDLNAVCELTKVGVRVSLEPVQPVRKVVIDDPAWGKAKIVAIAAPSTGRGRPRTVEAPKA